MATKKIKQTPKLRNKTILVLDNSGSMASIANGNQAKSKALIELKVNELFANVRDNARKFDQETDISFYLFNSTVKNVFKNKSSNTVANYNEYYFAGMTALFDATARAILDAQKSPEYNDENTSYLLLILTDGGENSSSISASELNKLIKQVDKTGRWTVTFQVPHGNKNELVRMGIYSDNIREWEATEEGIEEASQSFTSGLTSYYGARASGAKSVRSFYVQPDLSQVKTKELKECADLSGQFLVLNVPKESKIKEFVLEKTGNFTRGNNYYQLMKAEKIQSYKQIILVEKTTNKIYGGDEARILIGAPSNQEFKAKPGNHANFDIFIESDSVNRILPRGTKILVKK